MKDGWEIGQDAMAWFTHVQKNWIGFTYEDEYLKYIYLFLKTFVLLFILSYSTFITILFCFHSISFVAYIFKKRNNVPEDIMSNSWHKLRDFLARFYIKVGKLYYGHKIIGMEHIPEGPGIVAFYHGTMNVDYFLLLANLYVQRRQMCFTITDKALFHIPGLKTFLEFFGGIRGSKAECVEMLKNGHLLGLAPGGGREAWFSDENYKLMWGNRTGFAQVALEAKVPIIPMFTQNIQEAFRGLGRIGLIRWLYEETRVFVIPFYGTFPVKLCTYIGEPIPYDPNISAVELAEKTKMAIENLRDRYQKIPGSILRAISERFDKPHKDD